MKKILSLALGLAFVFGSTFAIAQDTSSSSTTKSKKKKKSKKSKSDKMSSDTSAPKQ